jgi:uncharacterized protein (DUF1778 family)
MSRLTIDLTAQQHQSIKAMAALQGKSIKDYAIERLLPAAVDEERALGELKALLTQRLAEASRGEVSAERITDIAEAALRSDGAR